MESSYGSTTLPSQSTRGRSRRRSRTRSRSASMSPILVRYRAPPIGRRRLSYTRARDTVHKFTRVTATNLRVSNEATITNYWYINNRTLNGIAYGGTTPAVFGNQISFYFDFLSVHMDLYSDAGALIQQVEYNVPAVAEFASLYEEYKIEWVQIDCFASQENAYRPGSDQSVNNYSPLLYYVKDYNDSDSTSLTQMMQHDGVNMWQPGIGNDSTYHRRIFLKPRPQFAVANVEGIASGTAQIPGLQWLNLDTTQTCPHYGIKMAVQSFYPTNDTLNTPSMYLNFVFTYHFSFRNIK